MSVDLLADKPILHKHVNILNTKKDVIMQNPSSVPGENFEIVYQNPSRVFDTASSAGVARNVSLDILVDQSTNILNIIKNDTMHDAYIVPKKKRAYTKRKPKSTVSRRQLGLK